MDANHVRNILFRKKIIMNPIQIILIGFPSLYESWLNAQLQTHEALMTETQLSACSNAAAPLSNMTKTIGIFRLRTLDEAHEIPRLLEDGSLHALVAWCSGPSLSDEIIIDLLNTGIKGILCDQHGLPDLVAAAKAAAENAPYINDVVSGALWHYSRKYRLLETSPEERVRKITTREKRAIELRRIGMTAEQIGAELFLSKKTIDKLFSELYRRLDCRNYFELLDKYKMLDPAEGRIKGKNY
jgi:DNA-binding NarL/FixJ family response regulator